jgi:hypothetical protein
MTDPKQQQQPATATKPATRPTSTPPAAKAAPVATQPALPVTAPAKSTKPMPQPVAQANVAPMPEPEPVIEPEAYTMDINLGKTVLRVQTETYKDKWYLQARFMYTNSDGELAYSRNGISIPLEHAATALQALVDILNAANHTELVLWDINDPEATA